MIGLSLKIPPLVKGAFVAVFDATNVGLRLIFILFKAIKNLGGI